jgi:hypothetical protein
MTNKSKGNIQAGESVWVKLTVRSGTPVDERPRPVMDHHRSMVRVTDVHGPQWELEGKMRDCFVAVDQDACSGPCGMWVRNISPGPCTLPYDSFTVRVTPIYAEAVMKWKVPETEEDMEKVYTMARAARVAEWEEGLSQETPAWILP